MTFERSSPNFNARVGTGAVTILVLHYTGMPAEEGALSWLCDPRSEVSCHWFLREDGEAIQLVDESRRAWHAGRSSWRGLTDVNSASIGIEIANPGHEWGYRPFPARQVQALVALCRAIRARHPIPLRNVVAHSDIAPDRKMDPGELFPWQVLADAGVALHVRPAADRPGPSLRPDDRSKAIEEAQLLLNEIGYGVPVTGFFCAMTSHVVRAFQRRFRPSRIDGILDPATVDTLQIVADAFIAAQN